MQTLTSRTDRWIDALCRRFSEATGWPLCFANVSSPEHQKFLSLRSRQEGLWSAELNDGAQSLGNFWLELPTDPAADRSFAAARSIAELLTEMAARLCSAQRKVDSDSRDLNTLVEISRTLPTQDNLRDALQRLLQAALKLTGYRSAAFFLMNPKTRELRLRAQLHAEPRTIPLELRKIDRCPPDLAALAEGKSLLRTDTATSASTWLPSDCMTGCCFRVLSKEGPLGTFWVYDRRARSPVDREVHVLESIAAQIAAVLERSVLLHESETQQRLQRELKIASENQSMGVQHEPLLDSRLDVSMLCTSHYEVGGDLCEVFSLDEHRTFIAVGDAAGDSIPASLVMSSVRGALRALLVGQSHAELRTELVMRRINSALYSITPSHQFMSLILGIIDTRAGTFCYCNAGHPAPVVLHRTEVIPMHSHGLLLGVMDESDYGSSTVEIGPGDLLVMYSDGISEARAMNRRMFRSDGILDAVRDLGDKRAEEIRAAVMLQLMSHLRGSDSADDRTLLVIRIREEAAAKA